MRGICEERLSALDHAKEEKKKRKKEERGGGI
jgi:hypothetical protein